MRRIYFDYNATTPLDAGVREAMLPFLGDVFGNPSSVHRAGQEARACLDDARDRVSRVLGCKPSEIVFTSGGTESANLALCGAARRYQEKGRHIIVSAVEHHAVLNCCEYLAKKEGYELTVLPVNAEGRVSVACLEKAIRRDTILVSIMAANNETGTIQPVAELGAMCREKGVIFHTDAVQWLGKESFSTIHQFNANLVSICAHKFYGPKGAGALFIKSPTMLDPIHFGGSHEYERRAGTENLSAIAGFAAALERFVKVPIFPKDVLWDLTRRLSVFLTSIKGITVQSPQADRLSNTIAFTVKGCDSLSLLAGLDMEGICASSGAACSAGSLRPSHVLLAMGTDNATANSLIRFSLGRESTLEEVLAVEAVLPDIIKRIRGS